jgi:hypothetical protein
LSIKPSGGTPARCGYGGAQASGRRHSPAVLIAEPAGRQGIAVVGKTNVALDPVLLGMALPVVVIAAAVITPRAGSALLVAAMLFGLRQVLCVFFAVGHKRPWQPPMSRPRARHT